MTLLASCQQARAFATAGRASTRAQSALRMGLTNQMKRVPLGSSDLSISEITLGTMTWGNQVRELCGPTALCVCMQLMSDRPNLRIA